MKMRILKSLVLVIFTNLLLTYNSNGQYLAELLTPNKEICENEIIEIKIKFTGNAPFDAKIQIWNNLTNVKIAEIIQVSNFTPVSDGIYTGTLAFSFNVYTPRVDQIRIKLSEARSNPGGWSTNVSGEALVTSYVMPTPNAGNDANSCGYSIPLAATPGPQSSNYYWQSATGNFMNITNPTTIFTSSIQGNFPINFIQTNGACQASDQVIVTLKGSPTGTISTTSKICETGNATLGVTLTGNGPWDIKYTDGNLNWDINNISSNNHNWQQSVNGETTYALTRITDNNGCIAASNQMTGNAKVFNLKQTVNAGPDGVACGLTYTMQALAGTGSGIWSGPAGTQYAAISSPVTLATVTNFGLQSFTWTINNEGCISQNQVNIRFVEKPTLSINNATPQICEGSAAQVNLNLTGSSPWNISYLLASSPFNINLTTSPAVISLTPSETANYQITRITDSYGCFNDYTTQNFTITVDKKPTPNAGTDIQNCGTQVTLSAIPSIGTGQWSGSGTFEDTTKPGSSYTNGYGTYTLRWTETNGLCSGWDETVISLWQSPEPANAGPDQTLYLEYETLMQAANPTYGIGTWSIISGTGTIKSINNHSSEITGLKTGKSTFRWTVTNGTCASVSDDVDISVTGLKHVTGFSPNGDGINDYFEILGANTIKNNELIIFNQAGEIVYKKKNYTNQWTGLGMDGTPVADGYYYFIFSAPGIDSIKDFLVIKRSTR